MEHEIPKQIYIDRAQKLKTICFFAVLAVIVIAAAFLRFTLDDTIQLRTIGSYFGFALCVILILTAFVVYLLFSRRDLVSSGRELYAIGTAVVLSYVISLALGLAGIFAIPAALAAFIIAPLASRRDAFIANLFFNLLMLTTLLTQNYFSSEGSFYLLEELTIFILGVAGGTVAAYAVASRASRFGYVLKGIMVAAVMYGFTAVFTLLQNHYMLTFPHILSVQPFMPSLGFALIGCFAPILLGIALQPVLERAFNLLTAFRLVELTDHNSPLIKRLRLEAPGTFNHSLAVAGFAEMCASAIGENPYLARAAAYYHDIGKLENPEYYKENQTEVNLHDELLPEVSAEIIRAHTTDGLALCQKYRIPKEVASVTVQHHGTLLIPVFYEKAKKLTDSAVDAHPYSYHGVTPVSKIAAIIMLCDAGEAAIRAMDKPNGEKVDTLLSELIKSRIDAGQLNQCDISVRDLTKIKDTIISAYGGLFHKRLKYPGGTTDGATTEK
ncbi:MAG: HDIG domain-containing protein [Firmicutes bacterium]|nr:HDIG domain-containing protein [Bacillota bacterium]